MKAYLNKLWSFCFLPPLEIYEVSDPVVFPFQCPIAYHIYLSECKVVGIGVLQ